MPGKIGPPVRSLAMRLSRSSSFTPRDSMVFSEKGLVRNSPSVRGKLMTIRLPGTAIYGDYTPAYGSQCVAIAPGFLAHVRSAAKIGKYRFEKRNQSVQSFV